MLFVCSSKLYKSRTFLLNKSVSLFWTNQCLSAEQIGFISNMYPRHVTYYHPHISQYQLYQWYCLLSPPVIQDHGALIALWAGLFFWTNQCLSAEQIGCISNMYPAMLCIITYRSLSPPVIQEHSAFITLWVGLFFSTNQCLSSEQFSVCNVCLVSLICNVCLWLLFLIIPLYFWWYGKNKLMFTDDPHTRRVKYGTTRVQLFCCVSTDNHTRVVPYLIACCGILHYCTKVYNYTYFKQHLNHVYIRSDSCKKE